MKLFHFWIIATLLLGSCGGRDGDSTARAGAQQEQPPQQEVAAETPSPACFAGDTLAENRSRLDPSFPPADTSLAALESGIAAGKAAWHDSLTSLLPAAQAAPPPVGTPGNQDLLERVRQADGAAAGAAAGGTLPANIGAIRGTVAEALPCSEAGREYQIAALQYLDALAADAACKQAFQAIPQPTLADVNTLLQCQPTQALVAANNRKAQLAAQVAAEGCVVTAQTTPAAPPAVPPTVAPPPATLQTALANLLKGAANIAYGSRPPRATAAAAYGTSDPVDLFSGSYVQTAVDLAVPGLIPIELGRQYHSALADRDGPFGKGSGMVPYAARIAVKTDPSGIPLKAVGTELVFSPGDQTEIVFSDDFGTLEFTAFDKPGYAGARIAVQADAAGKLAGAQLLQPGGERFEFDAQGKLVRIRDRNGNAVQIGYDSAGRITQLLDPATGRGIALVYNEQGQVIRASGLPEQAVGYEYDQGGRLLAETDPLGRTQRYAYDARNRLVTLTDARGVVALTNVYDDASGVVTGQLLGDRSVIQIDYPDAATRRVIDGNGSASVYRYDASGLLSAFTTPLGQTTMLSYSPGLFSWEGGERIVTRTDGGGRTTTVELNSANQVVRIVDAGGRSARYTYGGAHQLLASATDAAGRSTTLTRDANGNVLALTDAAGNRAVFGYTARGQLAAATSPLGQTTRFEYDAQFNLTRVLDPLGNATSVAYDNLSRPVAVTNPGGGRSTYSWDNLNRLVHAANALGNPSSFTYDTGGNLAGIEDASGNTATISYDAMNRPLQATSADGRSLSMRYDAAGNLVESVDAKGQKTRYAYDAAGRLTEAAFADGDTFRYQYDGLNRLSAVLDGAGQRWGFSYDLLDRITGSTSPQGALAYTYDSASQLTQIKSPSGSAASVAYTYDRLGQIIAVAGEGDSYRLAYDCAGRRTALLRPNGVRTGYAWDAAGRLTELRHERAGATLQSHRYGYDVAGNITRYARSDDSLDVVRAYRYDAANRLIGVDAAVTGGVGQAESADWEFDGGGNIVRKTVRSTAGSSSRSMTYDRAGRLVSASDPTGTLTFTYDANGNLEQDSSGRKLSWNARNQLIRLEAGGAASSFSYDPLGRRVSIATGGASRNYFYSSAMLLADGHARFMPGIVIDEMLEMKTPARALSFLHDHLGSTTALLDASSANRAATYHYTSYGALEAASMPLADNPIAYTGREDDRNGLYYYRNRYYTPALEAFISRDPAGAGQRYAGGNPITRTDPLGLEASAFKLALRDAIFDIAGGIADTATFGATKALRDSGRARPLGMWAGYFGAPATIHADSPAYRSGQVAYIGATVFTGQAAGRAIANAAPAATVQLSAAARGIVGATPAITQTLQRAAYATALAREAGILSGLASFTTAVGLEVGNPFERLYQGPTMPAPTVPATMPHLDPVTGLPVFIPGAGSGSGATNVTSVEG